MVRVVIERDHRALLDGFLTAFGQEPCAVLDPAWSDALRQRAVQRVQEAAERGDLQPDSLVFFTSGSTGHPRAVHRSARSWACSAEVFTRLVGGRHTSGATLGTPTPVALPGPLHSTLFLFGAWHASTVGAPVILAGEDDREAVVMHVVPAMLPGVMERYAAGGLPRLTTLVVAGDRLPPAWASQARAAGLRLLEYYGAAELSLVAAREDDGPFRPVSGVEVSLDEGVVWSRSPYQAHGYLDTADQSAGPLRREGEWASVGDLGAARGDGFVVLGRGDAAVTTGGHTVVAEDVEAFLRGLPGVCDAAVVGVPHARLGQRLVAVVVGEAPVERLREAVRALPHASRPRDFVRRPGLPRTSAGKLLRAQVAESLLDAAGPLRFGGDVEVPT